MENLINKCGYNDFINKHNLIYEYGTYFIKGENTINTTRIILKLGASNLMIINNPISKKFDKIVMENIYNYTKNKRIIFDPLTKTTKAVLSGLVFIKIKSCEESIRLLGFKSAKTRMMESNNLYKIDLFYPDHTCKIDNQVRDMISIKDDYSGKSFKFLVEELEFIYPDIDKILKEYTPPKNRYFLVAGSDVKVVDNRKTNLNKKEKGIIKKIINIGNIKYCVVNINNKDYTINSKQLRIV